MLGIDLSHTVEDSQILFSLNVRQESFKEVTPLVEVQADTKFIDMVLARL